MKKQAGITLIALIITIIVMLILVAVTVTTAVQSGLFGHAGDAVQEYEDAQETEKDMENQFSANTADGSNVTGLDNIVEYYTNSQSGE